MEDEKTVVENVLFYNRPVEDKEATLREGRRVHKEVTYIRISNPGDPTLIVDRPARLSGMAVNEADHERYPKHWAAFEARQSQEGIAGTLLSVWGGLPMTLVEDYRFQRVLTVEQLAAVSDANLPRLGPQARQHREAAQAFLESSKSAAPVLRLQAQLAARDEQFSSLLEANRQMQQRLAALEQDEPEASPIEAATPRKRGRPAKKEASP